jgi:hypothetical protein
VLVTVSDTTSMNVQSSVCEPGPRLRQFGKLNVIGPVAVPLNVRNVVVGGAGVDGVFDDGGGDDDPPPLLTATPTPAAAPPPTSAAIAPFDNRRFS